MLNAFQMFEMCLSKVPYQDRCSVSIISTGNLVLSGHLYYIKQLAPLVPRVVVIYGFDCICKNKTKWI